VHNISNISLKRQKQNKHFFKYNIIQEHAGPHGDPISSGNFERSVGPPHQGEATGHQELSSEEHLRHRRQTEGDGIL
jgi:hypothetical protein